MKCLLALILVICLMFISLPAYALNNPETTDVEVVRVFRHMLEANDTLMVVRYNITYGNLTAQPTQPIDDTFDFTYTAANGTVCGNETAYPLFNLGYEKGLVAFYWDADDSLQPAWNDLGNVTAEGDASLFSPQPTDTLTLTSSDYSSYASPADIREDLRQWLISQLTFIDLSWNNWYADQNYENRQINLLATIPPDYIVLDASGEGYMTNVWEYMRDACPLLYFLQINVPTHTEEDWELSQQNIYEILHVSDYVGNATSAASDLLGGIGQMWTTTIFTLLLCVGVVVVTQYKWQKANIGLLIAYSIILLATPEGLFQMGLMALGAVIGVLVIVWTFFWSRSTG